MASIFSVSRFIGKGKSKTLSMKRSSTSKSKTLDVHDFTDTQPPTRAGSPAPMLLPDASTVPSRKDTSASQGGSSGLPTPPPTAAVPTFTAEPVDIPDIPSTPPVPSPPTPPLVETVPKAPDFGLDNEPTSTSAAGRPPSFVVPSHDNVEVVDSKTPDLSTPAPAPGPAPPSSESEWTQVDHNTPPTPPPEPTTTLSVAPPPDVAPVETVVAPAMEKEDTKPAFDEHLKELTARHEDDLRQLESLNLRHREDITQLQEDNARQRERIRQLEEETSFLRKQHRQLQEETTGRVRDAHDRALRASEEIHELEERNAELTKRIQEVTDAAKRTLDKSLLDLRTKLDLRLSEKDTLVGNLRRDFSDERATKERRIKELDSALKQSTDELALQRTFVTQLSAQLEQRDFSIASLEKQKSQLRQDAEEEHKELLAEIRRLNEVLTQERNTARSQSEKSGKEQERLVEEVDQRGEEIKRLSDQVARLQAENHGIREMLSRPKASGAPRVSDAEAKALGVELVKAEEKLAGIAREKRTLMEHIEAQAERLQQYQNQMISGSAMRDLYRVWTAPFAEFIKNVMGERLSPPAPSTTSSSVPLQPLVVNGTPAQDSRLEEAVNLTKSLNEEVYQLSASLADHFDAMDGTQADARFVTSSAGSSSSVSQPSSSPSSSSSSLVFVRLPHSNPLVDAAAAALKPILGQRLVDTLRQEAAQPPEEMNPFYLQTALQGVLIAFLAQTIRSWYPAESEYGTFLLGIYERLRGMVGWKAANYWRFFALQATMTPGRPEPLEKRLVSQLEEQITRVLLVSGWTLPSSSPSTTTSESSHLPPLVSSKLEQIAACLLRLHTVIHTSPDYLGQIEPRVVLPGDKFWSSTMCDDNAFDTLEDDDTDDERSDASRVNGAAGFPQPPNTAANVSHGPHFNEPVICTVGLGLDYARENQQQLPQRPMLGQPASRPSPAGFARIHEMLLKPRVVLHNALYDD